MEKQSGLKKLLAGMIYALVGIFFLVSYFLITTSGEDVFQGAGTEPAVLEDAGEAFQHNARIPDMYAWSVINFFDYQYSFGIDTIFRLIDVALGVGLVYMMARVALGRKLRLELRDAVIFGMGFLMLMLTPHGRVLYAGFSAIHNYLLIAVMSLGFGMLYLGRLKEQKRGWLADVAILVFGVGFGLSSNLTPIAFLMTFAVVIVAKMMQERKFGAVLGKVKVWEWLGVVGVLVGIGVAYIFGPGVSGYLDSGYTTEYDYVSLSEVLAEPVGSMVRMGKHVASNFGRVLLPVIGVLLVVAVLRIARRLMMTEGAKLKWWPSDERLAKLIEILAVFVAVHLLIATQLNAPIRILLPAYVAAVIAMLVFIYEWTREWGMEVLGAGVVVLVAAVVVARTALAIDYREKSGRVLEKIRTAETETVCVTREEVKSRTLPVVYLGQEDMLAEWAMPARVYEKEVVWCE